MSHPRLAVVPNDPTPASASPEHGVQHSLAVIDYVFGPASERRFDIRLWDGSVQVAGAAQRADFTLIVRRRGALRRMLLRPSELSIVEAFISGDLDVDGNLESIIGESDAIGSRIQTLGGAAKLIPMVFALPKHDDAGLEASQYKRALRLLTPRSRRSSAAEIQFHYDVGNEFYALWLDPRMLYTCAYYQSAQQTLADAQTAKLDHICKKLRLKPGETLLDIGCGWGGLVQYAAEHYGVEALGITLSAAQAEWAQREIARKGIGDKCRVEAMDFRDLPQSMTFDKMSSVGVTEHVPETEQPAYFARAYAALRPGGLFLNHCEVSISMARSRGGVAEKLNRWLWKRDQFIDKYVFPDAKLVSLGSIIRSAELSGFETRDIESLREHYTMTLRAWLRELERRKEEAIELVGERTYRVWWLYMAAAANGFNTGSIGLVQTLLSKPTSKGVAGLPLTRHDLYSS